MLLLHPVPTSADACPDLCTLCPDLCTLHPDLWTLCLWRFPSVNWCKYSTCTGGGCHELQLALVVLFHSATSADSPLAHVVVSPSATCAGGAFSSSHWRKYCTCTRATCTVWWYIYIYIYANTFTAITTITTMYTTTTAVLIVRQTTRRIESVGAGCFPYGRQPAQRRSLCTYLAFLQGPV